MFCSGVYNLLEELEIVHDPRKLRLFIDSSSQSLKWILLHHGNHYLFKPVDLSVLIKEDNKV